MDDDTFAKGLYGESHRLCVVRLRFALPPNDLQGVVAAPNYEF
jgi:hypothetical protein